MWNFALRESGTAVRGVWEPPTGNDTLTQTWSATTSEDCAKIRGAVFTDACRTTFLRRAVELGEDGFGNDNGLCESGEHCVFTPNFGAYQGEGPLTEIPFVDGAITGVSLFAYSINGR